MEQTMANDLPHLAGYIEQLGTPETLEQAVRERNAWVESAAQFSHNEDYYRGLLDQIAAHIGPEAWKADDGSVPDDEPVRARLPDLVAALTASDGAKDREIAELRAALRTAEEFIKGGCYIGDREIKRQIVMQSIRTTLEGGPA
jgi:hypothetical protein